MTERTFAPEKIFAALQRNDVRYVVIGGLAAALHGSPVMTIDADICPARDRENLRSLAAALRDLDARVRAPGAPDGLPFACDEVFLARIDVALNLVTPSGDLDVSFQPSGTNGYADLAERAVTFTIRGMAIRVASLEDVIRSKEAANRPKDLAALPALRLLLERIRTQR